MHRVSARQEHRSAGVSVLTRRNVFALGLLGAGLAQPAAGGRKLRLAVVGAHPDDPESGCGGTLARYAALGHEAFTVYLTRGEAGISGKSHEEAARIRTREAEEASKILGARPVFVGQVDGATELNRRRYEEFRQALIPLAPDIVLAHWPIDTHPDHRIASLLAYDAWQNAPRKFALYYFEVMTGEQTQNFVPTHHVDITAVEAKKRASCYAHASQQPAEFYAAHDAMNRFRGAECQVKYAEAFAAYAHNPETGAAPLY
ncbi:MAG TPA: PIG-L family deacetylase [Bryobacteraceae bacterium]|nr:PIG-L family deacetylase [Bryobacteraceae bacterium]